MFFCFILLSRQPHATLPKLQGDHRSKGGENTFTAIPMLKHPASKAPAKAGEACPVTSNRLVHEARFARCLSIWRELSPVVILR
jgi:hypothetical protein